MMKISNHPPGLMPAEHREAVLGVIERILLENEGNRITTALRMGILVSAQRLIHVSEPAPAPASEPAA